VATVTTCKHHPGKTEGKGIPYRNRDEGSDHYFLSFKLPHSAIFCDSSLEKRTIARITRRTGTTVRADLFLDG
jgi:hypothetical protein